MHTRVNPRDPSLDNFHGDAIPEQPAVPIRGSGATKVVNVNMTTKPNTLDPRAQAKTKARESSYAGFRPGFLLSENSP